jgi:hypothetical protein
MRRGAGGQPGAVFRLIGELAGLEKGSGIFGEAGLRGDKTREQKRAGEECGSHAATGCPG